MSKVDTEFCDCCGGILYHSIASYKLPSKSLRRFFWWHGSTGSSETEDICGDCFDAISSVLTARREKVSKSKVDALDKSPAQLMDERKPISPKEVKRILQ